MRRGGREGREGRRERGREEFQFETNYGRTKRQLKRLKESFNFRHRGEKKGGNIMRLDRRRGLWCDYTGKVEPVQGGYTRLAAEKKRGKSSDPLLGDDNDRDSR